MNHRSYSQSNLANSSVYITSLGGSRNPAVLSSGQLSGGGSRANLTLPGGYSVDSVELQKLLSEERLRSDQHRANYQLLKVELSKLQDAYSRLEDELTNQSTDHSNVLERCRREIQEYQRQLNELSEENQRLRVNQITEERLERLRMEINEEVDSMYKERYIRLESEAAACRAEVNRFRYENTFLKTEYEHLQDEHSKTLEEMKLMHDTELSNLRGERDQLLSRLQMSDDGDKLKHLHKENTHLHVQIRTLKAEIQELNASKTTTVNDMDLVNRNQGKEIISLRSTVRQLESEKEHLKQQVEESANEVTDLRSEIQRNNDKIHQLTREVTHWKHQVEEVCQKTKVDVTQLKLEAAKQRGEIERQRDVLAGKVEEMEYQLQLALGKTSQLERSLEDQERNFIHRENSFREEERLKQKRLEEEKTHLEEQLSESQKRLSNHEPSLQARLERLQDNLQQAEYARTKVETEMEQLQKKYDKVMSKSCQSQQEMVDLRQKLARHEKELEECYAELQVAKEDRKEKLRLSEQLARLQNSLQQQEERSRKLLEDSEEHWKSHDREIICRMKQLEDELNSSQKQLCALRDEQKQKKKRYGIYFYKQKQRMQVLEARILELTTENDCLKKNVPFEEHSKLKKELKELRLRHKEFKAVISCSMSANGARGATGDHVGSEEEFQLVEAIKRLKSNQDESEVRQKELFEKFSEILSYQQTTQHQVKSIDDCDICSHL